MRAIDAAAGTTAYGPPAALTSDAGTSILSVVFQSFINQFLSRQFEVNRHWQRTAEARSGMRLGSTVVRSLREGALWVFGALALIVLAALLSYDRNDPSFATTGEPGPISNVIGPLGAHLAGSAGAAVRRARISVPGHDRLRRLAAVSGSQQGAMRRRAPRWRFAASAFCSRWSPAAAWRACISRSAAIRIRPAACSARSSGRALEAGLSFLGATLLLLALWLAGVSLFAGVSWIEVMDRTGRATLQGVRVAVRRGSPTRARSKRDAR